MIISRTSSTKIKRIWTGVYDQSKTEVLYRTTTYWFLIIPLYTYEECIG